jgi:hypothetical protein
MRQYNWPIAFGKKTILTNIKLPVIGPCFGMDHEFKMVIYKGDRAYRCEKCTWVITLKW